MTLGQILIGFLIAIGFFVSAIVSRFFRRGMTGIIIGGVSGLAFSVLVLAYGMDQVFDAQQLGARGE